MQLIDKAIDFAVEALRNEELVVFPTETVYGIGADALNDDAVKKIYKIKNRPSSNPLIIHTYSVEMIKQLVVWSPAAEILSQLWPGPLTMVLQQRENQISKIATNSLSTIAVRIPSETLALNMLEKFGGYVAAPSANPSGYISPSRYAHVLEHYRNNKKVHILKGQNADIGIESTIIDLSDSNPIILRDGFFTAELISTLLGKSLLGKDNISTIRSPGMMHKHYSPKSHLKLNMLRFDPNHVGIGFGPLRDTVQMNLSASGDLNEASRSLYDCLRKADKIASHNSKAIAVSPIPDIGIGIAINDRLRRAAL